MFATVVDLGALWKILAAALATGVGLTAIFGAGAFALARVTDARRAGDGGAIAVNGAIVAAAGLVCLAAVALGLYAVVHK